MAQGARSRWRVIGAVALLVGATFATGSAANAAPGDDGKVHGCAGQVGGYLRAIEASQSCISTETSVVWPMGGFADWVVIQDDIPLSDTDVGVYVNASCDYANGYRLLYAVANHQYTNTPSPQRAVPAYLLLTEGGDGRPTGAQWWVSSTGRSDTELSYQLSCVK